MKKTEGLTPNQERLLSILEYKKYRTIKRTDLISLILKYEISINPKYLIKSMLQKINSSVKIRVKEPSIKVSVGREGMSDEKLIENIKAVYTGIVAMLPTKKENVKSALVKLTMSKPVGVEL